MLYSLIKTFFDKIFTKIQKKTLTFVNVTGKKRISIVYFVYKKDNKSVKSKGVRTWQKESKSLRLVEAAVIPPS
ncbi:hypothetical protein EGW23_00870 [Enterococcus faecium]|nr:hypothetical protein [Enterococcus faecium]EGP5286803.1 hypothetical protein [Enterococcus faecium]EGP5534113.1 hypothetical protein [Enterococcus faecium]EGP5704362.1 hypothetical protein [Enterococcus faecium]ONN36611.1 hypothetical protein BTN90_00875 [Enterococcus faecium]